MTILDAFSEFSRNYLMARCYSQKTIDGYWWAVHSFVEFAGNIETLDLTHELYADWVIFMDDKGNSKITIHTNVSRFKQFVDYLNMAGYSPLTKDQIKTPKKPKNHNIKWASAERVAAMIKSCHSIRDQAILAVTFDGAIRNAELRNLRRNDVDGLEVTILGGKGDEDGLVYLTSQTRQLLDRYLASRTDKSPYLFVSRYGDKIACSTLRYIFAHASDVAGVAHCSPHQLRHGAATELLRAGMDLRSIQEYLRHEYITTTQIYTHIERPRLKSDFQSMMPKLDLTNANVSTTIEAS